MPNITLLDFGDYHVSISVSHRIAAVFPPSIIMSDEEDVQNDGMDDKYNDNDKEDEEFDGDGDDNEG